MAESSEIVEIIIIYLFSSRSGTKLAIFNQGLKLALTRQPRASRNPFGINLISICINDIVLLVFTTGVQLLGHI